MRTLRLFTPLYLALLLPWGCSPADRPADLLVMGGRVVTMDPALPEAEAVAVKHGRIVAVGSMEDLSPYVSSSTTVLNAAGGLIIPGLIEGHGHFMGLGEAKMSLDLMKTRSWDEIVAMVREAATKARPGEWITGRGWHQEKWTSVPRPNVEGFPYNDALTDAAPDNPVYLKHASGHASVANAKAMEAAGVTPSTPDPEGGEIIRDRSGKPIGVFRETASTLLANALSAYLDNRTTEEIDQDLRKQADLAARDALSKGITSFQDAGSTFKTIDLFKTLANEGKLGVRLWVMVRDSLFLMERNFPAYRIVGYGKDFLTVRAIKWWIDGALGSRGAWLLEPYADAPWLTGLKTADSDSIMASERLALEHDLQICVHAIGDRANREVLDLFEAVSEQDPSLKGRRWRIEHAQHLHPDDIPRFAELGILPAMQGIHCTSDAPYVLARLGARRAEEGAYVWQKLLQSGATIVNGTDTPVEDIDPIACYYASVTRKLADKSEFYPGQKMSREEALRSYTIDAAYGAFEEDIKGSLTPGKLGDITVLSKDILSVPDDEITSTEVLYTIVGGQVRYTRGGGTPAGAHQDSLRSN